MATIEVLLVGYVNETDDGEAVRPTVSLVRSGDTILVVDPGILEDVSELASALAKRGITPHDVTHVFVTHHHIDHTRNVGLFPSAVVIDSEYVYRGDKWTEHGGDGAELAKGVHVMHTPGHSVECASLKVETAQGVVVATHAWWFADRTPELDPMAVDQSDLEASRERILAVADYVIPGHGAMFEVAPTAQTRG